MGDEHSCQNQISSNVGVSSLCLISTHIYGQNEQDN